MSSRHGQIGGDSARKWKAMYNRFVRGKVSEAAFVAPWPIPYEGPSARIRPTQATCRPERGGARPRAGSSSSANATKGSCCPICGKKTGRGYDNKRSPYDRLDLHIAYAHGEWWANAPLFFANDGGYSDGELSVVDSVAEKGGGCDHAGHVRWSEAREVYCDLCGLVLTSVPLVSGEGTRVMPQKLPRSVDGRTTDGYRERRSEIMKRFYADNPSILPGGRLRSSPSRIAPRYVEIDLEIFSPPPACAGVVA